MSHNGSVAEKFVYRVCKKSFLSLWSYANLLGKMNKELCDILVVCGQDIVIFSVKHIKFKESEDYETDLSRWQNRAINSSCKQIYGAERWTKTADYVIKNDKTKGVRLPEGSQRRVLRVAVALGGDNKVFLRYGDFGKGFVHVFDELSFNIILRELDTISDFTRYLFHKETFILSTAPEIIHCGEEDLLAIYLHNGRCFPSEGDFIIIDDIWKHFVEKEEYKRKLLADRDSYLWDRIIETFCHDALHDNLEFGPSLSEVELAVRTMALENRFSRRVLRKAFLEFMHLASQKKVRSRMVKSFNQIVYVFLAIPKDEDRQFRVAELGNRCFIARGLNMDCETVIGLATERYDGSKGFSFDMIYHHKKVWTDKDQNHMELMQREMGYFVQPVEKTVHEDEYALS